MFLVYDIKRLSHGVLVIARSINPRPHYQPESFSSRADNDRGLILNGRGLIRLALKM